VTPVWRRPIWLLGHLVALAAIIVFVRCGFWQIDRLHQKQARNRLIAERSDGPAVDLDTVPISNAEYQRVRVHGHFDDRDHVLVRNRAFEGTNGFHVLTPFVRDDGSVVLVVRGWIGLDDKAPPSPRDELTIEGLLLRSQVRRFGPKDPATGHLDVVNRVDIARVAQQLPGRDVYPLYLQLTKPAPPKGEEPNIVEPPARDEGPHRSYAIQWFLFAAVVLVGYPLLIRRRSQQGQAAVDSEDLPGDVAGIGGQQERD
jgi:cytochrome oxidase assembly protein ShyY1